MPAYATVRNCVWWLSDSWNPVYSLFQHTVFLTIATIQNGPPGCPTLHGANLTRISTASGDRALRGPGALPCVPFGARWRGSSRGSSLCLLPLRLLPPFASACPLLPLSRGKLGRGWAEPDRDFHTGAAPAVTFIAKHVQCAVQAEAGAPFLAALRRTIPRTPIRSRSISFRSAPVRAVKPADSAPKPSETLIFYSLQAWDTCLFRCAAAPETKWLRPGPPLQKCLHSSC
jgi:hypothetical protein